MSKKIFRFICLFICVFSITNNSYAKDNPWVDYKSPEGNFTASFPTTPELKSAEREDYTVYGLVATAEATEYKIIFSLQPQALSPKEQTSFLTDTVNMYVSSLKGKIKSENVLESENYSGKEIKFITEDKLHINYRIFFYKNILFTLHVSRANKFASSKDVNRFFESLVMQKVEEAATQIPETL